MRRIVDLSRSLMAGFRANQGDFDLEDAKRLQDDFVLPSAFQSCC